MFDLNTSEVSDALFTSKKDVIAYMAQTALRAGKISDYEAYVEAVLQREDMVSTEVGYSVAIPHGESDAVKETFVVCLKLRHPIVWDDMETSLIFMIGVPLANRDKEHIRILAMLSKNLLRDAFRDALMKADTKEAYFSVIKQLEDQ